MSKLKALPEKAKYEDLLEQLVEEPLVGSQRQLLQWWRQRVRAAEAINELLELVAMERRSQRAWEKHTTELKLELDKAKGLGDRLYGFPYPKGLD